jgi:hypothetical protein
MKQILNKQICDESSGLLTDFKNMDENNKKETNILG